MVVRNLYDPEGFIFEEWDRPLKLPIGRRGTMQTLAVPMAAEVIPLDHSYYDMMRNDQVMDINKPMSWREYPSFLAQCDDLQLDPWGKASEFPRVYRIWDAVPISVAEQQAIDVAVQEWYDRTNLDALSQWYSITAGRRCYCPDGEPGACWCECGEDPHACKHFLKLKELERDGNVLDPLTNQPHYSLPHLQLPREVLDKWTLLKNNSRLNWHMLRRMAQTTSDYTQWLRDERMFNPWS